VREDLRAIVASAGPAIWTPASLQGPPQTDVALSDVIALPVGWLAIGRAGDGLAIAPVVSEGSGIRRARQGDGVFAALLDVLARGAPGLEARHAGGSEPAGRGERAIGTDLSNESVVIGDGAVVKLFARPRPGPQPGVELPAHLVAVGFREMPAPIGSLWWGDALVATMTAFVPDARDGWDWYVNSVEAAAAGDAPWAEADAHASAIGELVARLHRALATPSPLMPSPVEQVGADRIAAWRRAAESTLAAAVALTDGPEGDRLRTLAPAAIAAFALLERVDRTPAMRIHGDLHVGQVLQTADGALLVNDFDGNPIASAARLASDAPARDVAAMVCAIDHVGRVVAHRRADAAPSVVAWIERSRTALLGAYRTALRDEVWLLDERLLPPFTVAQEAHEYEYAARYTPRWRHVPDVAMPAALARIKAT
jgi:maltokinase